VSDQWHRGQEFGGELFISVDGELIDTHGVGVFGVSIVSSNDGEIFFKDKSSESFFLDGPRDSVFLLPRIEGCDFRFR
jgi:hypothetical protein